MQGWRKTMEDAHVASTDIAINGTSTISSSTTTTSSLATAKIFGVFDGHGGPEVARFCQLYLVDVWVKQMQQLLTTNITTTNATTTGTGTDAATDTAKPPHIMQEETPEQQRPNPADTPVGQALIRTFHALDRMIDDMNRRCVM
jgi:serine/threonine protein phosphatase PrpC